MNIFQPIIINEEMRKIYKPMILFGSYFFAGLFVFSVILMCIFRDPTLYCECLTDEEERARKRRSGKGLKNEIEEDFLEDESDIENGKQDIIEDSAECPKP